MTSPYYQLPSLASLMTPDELPGGPLALPLPVVPAEPELAALLCPIDAVPFEEMEQHVEKVVATAEHLTQHQNQTFRRIVLVLGYIDHYDLYDWISRVKAQTIRNYKELAAAIDLDVQQADLAIRAYQRIHPYAESMQRNPIDILGHPDFNQDKARRLISAAERLEKVTDRYSQDLSEEELSNNSTFIDAVLSGDPDAPSLPAYVASTHENDFAPQLLVLPITSFEWTKQPDGSKQLIAFGEFSISLPAAMAYEHHRLEVSFADVASERKSAKWLIEQFQEQMAKQRRKVEL